MALGDSNYSRNNGGNNYSNDQKKDVYRPTVYGYAFANTQDDAVDKSKLSFSMWKSTIKISIAKCTGENNGYPTWDRDNQASIFLTPYKAKIFADIMEKFYEDPVKYNGYGIDSGKSLITISNGEEFDHPNHFCIVIRLVNRDSGKTERVDGFDIKRTGYALYDYNGDSSFSRDNETFKDTEFFMIVHQLRSYADAASNSIAFSVADTISHSMDYLSTGITKIGYTVGAFGKNSGGSKSYFASDNSGEYSNASSYSDSGNKYNKSTEISVDDL